MKDMHMEASATRGTQVAPKTWSAEECESSEVRLVGSCKKPLFASSSNILLYMAREPAWPAGPEGRSATRATDTGLDPN
eukprot:CAMPEP_0177435464 /NCGR_PEP_ID=MMETSP0369-20130122/1097_1 /TAXON_ID=447022 ORGANISM="Scrippsiella hangoei-like, Strain SHHI-4" /NCGR_SAMPLE_ID=MMETSP0369 /ASSEMBLY_ACC=CAM_ASM_000364 /LENGTH=78 /DNA_ID=CAMNT_0018906689 /DNA_START=231 /DNA_END=464 /DNA_ORIENTATION=+